MKQSSILTEEARKRIGLAAHTRWQNPEFRAHMLEKQKALGLRSYRT